MVKGFLILLPSTGLGKYRENKGVVETESTSETVSV
jgi:hypothetical protein